MRVLFVGLGGTRVAWYRIVLPALYWPGGMQDWATMTGSPPALVMNASWIQSQTVIPDFFDYDVVVLEQVRGHKWMEAIKKLRHSGIKVVYETDDFVHGVRDVPDHEFSGAFQDSDLKNVRMCMRACDAMIVSTPYLAELYRDKQLCRKIYVCENGLDLGRYKWSKPLRGKVNDRETRTILWSGATGHLDAVKSWLPHVAKVMSDVEHASFVSIGKDFAGALRGFDGRTLTIPFASLETYTAAMMAGDVAIGPSGKTQWHLAKSQLRAMESLALGIPMVADPFYRETIEACNGGFVAESAADRRDMLRELLTNDVLREEIGTHARRAAHEQFGMQHRVQQWVDVLTDVLGQTT